MRNAVLESLEFREYSGVGGRLIPLLHSRGKSLGNEIDVALSMPLLLY